MPDRMGDRAPADADAAQGTPTPERANLPESPTQTGAPGAAPPGAAEREFTVAQRGQVRMVFRRFLRHRAAMVSLVVFLAILIFAFVVPLFWPYGYAQYTPDESVAPSWSHPFGTTSQGLDEFALVMRGTQRSIEIALVVAALSGLIGSMWGAIAGYYRGWLDAAMMRFSDLILTFPLIAIAAVLGNVASGTWYWIAIIIAALQWAYTSRVVRGVVLSLREKEFVEAARALGASDRRIIARHLLPNTLGPIIVNMTVLVALSILIATALSYIGFGVSYPDTSLGLLVTNAESAVSTRPWLFYFPGVFIIMIALTINFVGDGLRDALDPQQGKVRK